MTHPAFQSSRRLLDSVREGRSGPVTCATCGCRLTHTASGGTDAWYHFSPMDGRDARGCRVACAEEAHDVFGYSLAVFA